MSETNSIRHLVPVPGRRVRKPDGSLLPAQGEALPMTAYWRRRLRDGDVRYRESRPGKTVKQESRT